MLLLLLCRCFDVRPKQDDKGDTSNRENGSGLGRNLGGDLDICRASCCVIGLSLSPNNCLACLYTISLDDATLVQSKRSTSSQHGQSFAQGHARATCGYHGRGTTRSVARADGQVIASQPVVQTRDDNFLTEDMSGTFISF
ncbi:hypothetical protein V6N12_062090 [Hibiscus sabdariffa]|uniref:Uncharacterized protein n=1 Tax=Hibiscus sabdariffa TaxID=183260 RepID=A0ABR2F7U6_9ROSI